MREFFEAVDSDIGKALFMFYAVSGLRKNEALSLSRNDIDFGNRMVTPKCHSGSTKHSYVSFYNEEAEVILENVVGDDKVFPISEREYRKVCMHAWFGRLRKTRQGFALRLKCYVTGSVRKCMLDFRNNWLHDFTVHNSSLQKKTRKPGLTSKF